MAIETGLPPRYEIRTLEPKDIEWACALVAHSTVFGSPVWKVVYPQNQTRRSYDMKKTLGCLISHQVASGHSLGVFDTEYQFKREESAATGGKLYWDESDEGADGEKLLEQMDFPLVSTSLAYDSFPGYDPEQLKGLMDALPALAHMYDKFAKGDKRDEASWKANGPGEVLFRGGTNTRPDYEGRGLMKAAAHCMMREAASKGFRAIDIRMASDAVRRVWTRPPAPFRSEVICEWQTWDGEEEGENPLRPARQTGTKVYCRLNLSEHEIFRS